VQKFLLLFSKRSLFLTSLPTPPHLVHGTGEKLEPPAWPPIEPAEAAAVLARFPQAGALHRLAWHSPRPFSAATLADTSNGQVFLKRHYHGLRPAWALTREHAFIDHLARAGLRVARVLRTDAGSTVLQDSNWIWEVHEAEAGLDLYRDRQSWTPFLSTAHASAAGAALARLHLAARGFEAPSRATASLIASLTILNAADPQAAAEAYVTARPALQDYLADKPWRADLRRVFDMHGAAALAPALAAQKVLWTHNDWHPSNLLWAPSGDVACVLDFGLADRGCALHDLAVALERTAVHWLELGTTGSITEPAAAHALLEGYHSVLPLTEADRALLARLLPLVHVEFAMSETAYFHGILGRRDDADMAWDGYLIGHAEWFLGPEGLALRQLVAGTA
jgi:Ser/Thr protein kinase RdoA (MazF antagonist)